MKIFANHWPDVEIDKSFSGLSSYEFSLFLDRLPESTDQLSPINIWAHQEPNVYTGYHDWVIANSGIFSVILTWSDKILNNCKNAIFLPFGSTWLSADMYRAVRRKNFVVSHVRGNYNRTYGHSLRYEFHDRAASEVHIPSRLWVTAGDRNDTVSCATAKCELFGDAQFGVVIENSSHRGYFTEKIMEMFLLRTIPVYWGCSNISDFFARDGVFQFSNVDDAIATINGFTEDTYPNLLNHVEINFSRALSYISFLDNLAFKIRSLFEQNGVMPRSRDGEGLRG